MRIAMGISYAGTAYQGWQSQPSGITVQDTLERALQSFMAVPDEAAVRTMCAGRTDAGVHALNQVIHFDTRVERDSFSWVRGTNRFLPSDIAVQWCQTVPDSFHSRNSAIGRRYVYIVLESPVRPSVESQRVGWSWRPLSGDAMREAAALLEGEHDFSAFRSSECQALTPVKHLRRILIEQRGAYWRFEFEANAFLHHMVRNLMGCLIAVGTGSQAPQWVEKVLAGKKREFAAPTFAADGLYFAGPQYDPKWGLPQEVAALSWLP